MAAQKAQAVGGTVPPAPLQEATILLLPGDGIGPEVVGAARQVLEAAAGRFGFRLRFEEALVGGAAIDATGEPLPEATLAAARRAQAVLLGAVGGPRWDELPVDRRPEKGLLQLRQARGSLPTSGPCPASWRRTATRPSSPTCWRASIWWWSGS